MPDYAACQNDECLRRHECCYDGWWTYDGDGWEVAREALQETNP